VIVLIADMSDAVAADPIAVGAPAAYPAMEPSPIADRNPFMRPCCASAEATNQSVPRAKSSAGRSTGGADAAPLNVRNNFASASPRIELASVPVFSRTTRSVLYPPPLANIRRDACQSMSCDSSCAIVPPDVAIDS